MKVWLPLTLFLFTHSINAKTYSQSSICPPNIDFSSGNFSNWECRSGKVVVDSNGLNAVQWLRTGEEIGRHTIIPPDSSGLDPFGNFLITSPIKNAYSVKLGYTEGGESDAQGLFYTFTIPATNNKFSLLYYYAIVMRNPGHAAAEQPRFRARVIDVSTDAVLNCISFDFTSSGSLPGFLPAGSNGTIYKGWTPISVDLSGMAGKTVKLEFITSDCVPGPHFGYAYISIASFCGGSFSIGNYCKGDSTTTVKAPYGFQNYEWYSDSSFTQQIGNQQELLLNINTTPLGSVLPLVLTPYLGYGCVDTIYVVLERKEKPVSNAGVDKMVCSKGSVQLGALPSSNYEYTWMPKEILNNPFVANPYTSPGLLVPTNFTVQTKDLITGCVAFDTVMVKPILVDTSSTLAGSLVYCPGEAINTSLSINNRSTLVQWFKEQNLIPTATGFSYRPTSVGSYWAEIRQFGCTDSSRKFIIYHAPLPKVGFEINHERQCINEPVEFINTTTSQGNEPLRYLWKFSDGSTSLSVNPLKEFNATGAFTATLIATTSANCVDSIQKKLVVVSDCVVLVPNAFTPNNDGKNDLFMPLFAGSNTLKRFTVYNRWGGIVFTTNKEGFGWDGTMKGASMPSETFVWTVEYVTKHKTIAVAKGTVILIR